MRATEPSIRWKVGNSSQTPGCQCTGPIIYGYRKTLSLYLTLTPAKSNAQFSFVKSPPEIFNHKPSLISTCRKGSIIIYPGLNDWCVLVQSALASLSLCDLQIKQPEFSDFLIEPTNTELKSLFPSHCQGHTSHGNAENVFIYLSVSLKVETSKDKYHQPHCYFFL